MQFFNIYRTSDLKSVIFAFKVEGTHKLKEYVVPDKEMTDYVSEPMRAIRLRSYLERFMNFEIRGK